MCRFKQWFFLWCFISLWIGSCLSANWNEKFDAKSDLLIEQLAHLQNPSYLKHYNFFKKMRAHLLINSALKKLIQDSPFDEKLLVKKNNLVIKKRKKNQYKDFFAWENSYLTGSHSYIVPSFPIKIEGKIAIVQRFEKLNIGKSNEGFSPKLLKKVNLETYWKALLQAYVLGLGDLVAANISISSQGMIRFFDTEGCFLYRNTPFKTSSGIKMGFLCHCLDWPQYQEPLDDATAKKIQQYIQVYSQYKNNLQIYLKHRTLTFDEEGLDVRLENIKNFVFERGTTFQDFYSYIYSKMGPGLNELSHIVSAILKEKTGHGSSLFFLTRRMRKIQLTNEEKNTIQKWIDTYVD